MTNFRDEIRPRAHIRDIVIDIGGENEVREINGTIHAIPVLIEADPSGLDSD